MSEKSDSLTLYERQSDGQKSMKIGDHGDRMVLDDDEVTADRAVAVVNLDEAVTMDELVGTDIDDLPDIVDLFLDEKSEESAGGDES